MKRTPLKRKGALVRKRPVQKQIGTVKRAKKRITQKDMWAEFGLEKPAKPRYSGLAGILWYVMSRYVRQEEFKKYGGKCIDNCGVAIDNWWEADCGHFRSAKSLATRFLRENLAIQRKHCNSPWGGNGRQYDFGKEIDRRYGEGTADRLTELSMQTTPAYPKSWYVDKIAEYQQKLAILN